MHHSETTKIASQLSWRQTLGTMAARNFQETDSNVLYPRIDIGGDKSGITWLWYDFWVLHLTTQYQVHHFYFGTGLANGLKELTPHIPRVVVKEAYTICRVSRIPPAGNRDTLTD
jgi:hypothetical protein